MTSYSVWLVSGNVGGREIYRAFPTEAQAKAYVCMTEEGSGYSTLKVKEVTQVVG